MPNGRRKVLASRWVELGGAVADQYDDSVHYIIADVPDRRVLEILKIDEFPSDAHVVRADWVTQSILNGTLCDSLLYAPGDVSTAQGGSSQAEPEQSRAHNKDGDHSDASTEDASDKDERNPPQNPPAVLRSQSSASTPTFPALMLPSSSGGDSQIFDLDALIRNEKEAPVSDLGMEDEDNTDLDDGGDLEVEEEDEDGVQRIGETQPSTRRGSSSKPVRNQDRFLCMQKNGRVQLDSSNKNKALTDLLKKVLERHEADGDQWRILSYRKAIQILKRYPRRIESGEEARKVHGIGGKIAEKIDEIIRTGRLRKAEYEPEELRCLQLFQKIHGCGIKVARQWYAQGFRTLDDLRTKAKLTHEQSLGLEHFDDLQTKMSREECGRIGRMVQWGCQAIDPKFECYIMGSYRRGAEMCGDCDVIVTHPDNQSHSTILPKLMERLRKDGLIVADLARRRGWKDKGGNEVELEGDEKGEKRFGRIEESTIYMGIVRLPGGSGRVRRLDILIVPYDELGAALMHFTGNDIFNRSIRKLAGLKGYRLSQHGLFKDPLRGKNRVKITDGERVAGRTEQEIFDILGVPWRPPEDRNC
ncbi:hypothetical protein HDV00_010990 [Rhizophlyctis rosea]|nr:hypothetical protein HDV00_010990 [Rhizophlyctis rosea]